MRKQYLILLLTLIASITTQGQSRGAKVGYIDMEYILQNVPNYTEAQNQLEQRAQKWKQEIEVKKTEINKLKEALKAEKALLTKGLIEERITEIVFLEKEVLDYQQMRFGPSGDLMTLKSGLTKPIQDQVFTIVQDIAESKKYDFIFDKSSDLTMLFAAKRYDISDQIIRVLNRTEKREQLTKKQQKELEAKEAKEEQDEELANNPELQDRKKSIDIRNAARETVISNRILLQEERRKAAEERKLKIIADREAAKNAATAEKTTTEKTTDTAASKTEKKATPLTVSSDAKKTGTVSESTIADKKTKAEEPEVSKTIENGISAEEIARIEAEEAKQKQAEERAKIIADRNKAMEDRRQALEDRRKKILEEREAAKKASEEKK